MPKAKRLTADKMEMVSMTDVYNPFGEPDGSRENISDLDFVPFDDHLAWGGLATKPDDLTARVLIGRKGSGKTIHLRRQRAHAATTNELYAARLEQSPPDSSLVVRFAFKIKGHDPIQLWKLIWLRAILRATASHVRSEPQLSSQVSQEIRQRLANNYKEILNPAEGNPTGIFSEIKTMLAQEWTYKEFDRFIHSDKWSGLKDDLNVALKQSRRICFYLDAVDEYYESAPRVWIECQVGLFYAIIELLNDQRFGGVLHVFAALRDTVMLKVLQAEHGLRYFQERHVRTLDWDYKASLLFLHQKIQKLDSQLLAKPNASDPITQWLGVSVKHIESRNVDEPINQYLLRHTRLLPRDIIIQGNILCFERARSKWFAATTPSSDAIREGVGQASIGFGKELVNRCASYMLAEIMPDEAIQHGYESNYLEKTAGLHEEVRKQLRRFLNKNIKHEKISGQRLVKIEQDANDFFAEKGNVLAALWLNGLLGYVDEKRGGCIVFYSHRHASELDMPTHKRWYAFHSCLIDSIGLQPAKKPMVQCA